MFAVISKFTIDNKDNMTASVRNAYRERPHLVENAAGFVLQNPDEIWLITYWTDQTSFQEWYRTHLYKEAHANVPAGLKLISDRTEMLFFEHISS
jgi:heme-degrading monooxygenase HmoA